MFEIISQNLNTDSFCFYLAEIEYDGELSAMAYIILATVLMVIIGGLGWCFYRAVTAADKEADKEEDVQHHDEIGD